jgi:hypothetical protein
VNAAHYLWRGEIDGELCAHGVDTKFISEKNHQVLIVPTPFSSLESQSAITSLTNNTTIIY